MAILAGLPRRALVLRADTGIADQHVEALLVVEHQLGKLADLGERGQIGLIEHRLAATDPLDLVGKGLRPLGIAAMDQDPGAGSRQLHRHVPADAIGGTGDQHGLACHIHRNRPSIVRPVLPAKINARHGLCHGAASAGTAEMDRPQRCHGRPAYSLSRGLPSRGAAPRVNVNAF